MSAHETFERIDAQSRWAGVALVDAHLLGSTAAMLGDWDLQSTLLRRALQEGALRLRPSDVGGEPLARRAADDLDDFQRKLVRRSRGARPDWVSRYLLPPIEEFATERLMETAHSAAVAGVGRARADAWRGLLLHPRMARRRARLASRYRCRSISIASRLATPAPEAAAGPDADPAGLMARRRARAAGARLVGDAPCQRLGSARDGARRPALCRGLADRARGDAAKANFG